jgi:hypothetical protein
VTSPHPVTLSATATLDQRRVLHGTVDTAAQLHVCKGARKGDRILLKGITGDTVNAERADVVFPCLQTSRRVDSRVSHYDETGPRCPLHSPGDVW